MKAVVSHEFGRASVEEVPRPDPEPGEVGIRVNRVQLSVTECRLFGGERISYFEEVERRITRGDGRLFGHEFCGEVAAVGDGVTAFEPGDRVYAPGKLPCGECAYCARGYRHLCANKELIGYHRPGALSEYTCLPAVALARVPDAVTDAAAAALQPLASALLSVHEADLQPGDVVAVIGTGVMGYNVGQVARALGAGDVFAVDLVPEKLDLAERRGLVPVDAGEEDPAERVRGATDGIGADVVFEAVGGPQGHVPDGESTLAVAYELVRRGGRLVQIGNVPGDVTVRSRDLRKKSVDWLHPTLGMKATGPNADTGRLAAKLVASGDVSLSEYITHELDGLEAFEEAIAITLDPAVGLGPAQLVLD